MDIIAVLRHDIGEFGKVIAGIIQHHAAGVHGTKLRGLVVHRHPLRADTAAAGIALAQVGGQHTTVGTDRHLHQIAAGEEALVLQSRMDLRHDLVPQDRRRIDAAGGHTAVALITHPAGAHIVGAVAHEVAVTLIVGGTGLTGQRHAAEGCGSTGAAGNDIVQDAVHQRGSAGLHGHVGLDLILQDHVAVAVLHPGEGAGLGVDALVDESTVSRRHLLGGDALGIAAQCHGAHLLTVGLGQGGEAQTAGHKVIGVPRTQFHAHPHGAGVQRRHQRAAQRHQTLETTVVILGIGTAVQLQHRVIVDGGRTGDNTLVQRRRVGADRLGGGAAGPHGGGPVKAAVIDLATGAAYHGHHITGIGINDGNGALQLFRLTLAVGAGVRRVAEILEYALGDLLIFVILGGIDLVALIEQRAFRRIVVIAVLVHQRLDHILDQRVSEVGVAGLVLSGHRRCRFIRLVRLLHHSVTVVVAGVAVAVGKDHFLRLGGVILLLGDLVLVQHGVQYQNLALAVLLPAPFALKGAELGGIVGDRDQAGTLGQRQFTDALAKIGTGSRLHAVAGLTQIDVVQICLQDLILFIALFYFQRPVDLRHLTLDGDLIVAGDVFDQLLGDGGTTLHAPAQQSAENGAHGTLEVHTVVLFKTLVLNSHGSVLQVLGDRVKAAPDPVLAVTVQGLIHDPFLSLGVQIVQLRGDLGLQLVDVDLHMSLQGCVDPCHEDPGENHHGQHHYQYDGADDAARLSLLFGTGLLRLLMRFIVSLTGALLWPAKQAAALFVLTHNRAPPFLFCILGCSSGPSVLAGRTVHILTHFYVILVLYHVCQMLKKPSFDNSLSKTRDLVSISALFGNFSVTSS